MLNKYSGHVTQSMYSQKAALRAKAGHKIGKCFIFALSHIQGEPKVGGQHLDIIAIVYYCNFAAHYCNCVLQQQQPNLHDLYFQQDGAPSLYFRGVLEHLDETFPMK